MLIVNVFVCPDRKTAAALQAATRTDDQLRQYVETCTVLHCGGKILLADFTAAYAKHVKANISSKSVAKALKQLGYVVKAGGGNKRYVFGLAWAA